MRDMLADGAEFLATKLRSHASSRVHYLRSDAAIYIPAMRGQSSFDVTDSEGMLSRVDTHDFLILATDLLIDGIAEQPKVGDRIIVGELDDGQAYEVAAIAGQDHWRWADEHQIRYRVHTKHVGAHP